jgi:excisionase family DNA binding protein
MNFHSESEFLTVEQFAKRLQVSRTTVFGWLKKGDLREGVHYIRIGRILRFRWPFPLTDQQSLQTSR